MPGKQWTGSNKTYLYIIGGDICQKADEATPGARRRDFENKITKVKGTKWELVHRSWEGIITSLDFRDTDYGQQLNIEFDDAVLTLSTESRYFSDFAKKVQSLEMGEPVEIAPYDFETEDKKRLIGMNLIQNGKKAKNYYWNEVDNVSCNGYPKPIGDTKRYKTDDWQVFYIGVKKFFVAEIEKLGMSRMHRAAEQEEVEASAPKSSQVDEEIPIVGMEEGKDEIKIEDVPF